MRIGVCFIAALAPALVLAGCVADTQERLADYNQDGVFLFRHGDYHAARECFQAALTLQPGDADLVYNIGECFDHEGSAARAEHEYLTCLQRNPDHADCRFALASLYARTQRLEDAAKMGQDWLAQRPQLAAAFALDGWVCERQGDLPRAQARLQQALEIDPNEPHALVTLGTVYEALNRPDRAAALYDLALQRRPDQPDVAQHLDALQAKGINKPRPD
jgi:tetratricopeptide (TPR) repeat protein